jgi:hypothetical protein
MRPHTEHLVDDVFCHQGKVTFFDRAATLIRNNLFMMQLDFAKKQWEEQQRSEAEENGRWVQVSLRRLRSIIVAKMRIQIVGAGGEIYCDAEYDDD